ncbi:hypothetical protein DPMN_172254 [Dreissena polymorpha]|uniref:Uncharacterized protein n=1 Tax=Dreissena polymorpha TaxID=45954 RepID=A0A9D4E2K7_DREPO|nr:hypothetical protein DPMN_172254 [Dreissena polymorpha]
MWDVVIVEERLGILSISACSRPMSSFSRPLSKSVCIKPVILSKSVCIKPVIFQFLSKSVCIKPGNALHFIIQESIIRQSLISDHDIIKTNVLTKKPATPLAAMFFN